jgi:hypothetical protein
LICEILELHMKHFIAITAILAAAAFAPSCATKNGADTNTPRATVYLRDGTSFAGLVKSTSPSEITLVGDDNNSHTFDMKTVKSVEYAEAATAVQPQPAGTPAPAPMQPPAAPASRALVEQPRAPRDHPEESTINSRTSVLPVGTQVTVRTDETIDSRKAAEGQTFAAEISKDVRDAAGDVVIPRGSNAQLVIRSASRGGRFTGASDLVLDLHSVSVGGRQYRVDTADLEQKGRAGIGKNKRTGEFVGGGAALGAIIGAIAGGGKGAAIGAASGAGAGAGTQLLTRGGAVRVPAESLLTFKLDEPLRVYPVR